MAQIDWALPALASLDTIANYIALDNPEAAKRLVKNVFTRVERLAQFPSSGSRLPELPRTPYRQLVVRPCRIIYKLQQGKVTILFVMRQEQLFHTGS